MELDDFNFLEFEPVPVFVPVQYSKGNASGLQLELDLALTRTRSRSSHLKRNSILRIVLCLESSSLSRKF